MREKLVVEVRYAGNPEHKRNPRDFGLTPPLRPRPDKTLCDDVAVTTRSQALARLVAEHLRAGLEERLLPATDAKTARQKFQRAFAQEFLCPFEELTQYLETEDPTDEKNWGCCGIFRSIPPPSESTPRQQRNA
jgi:hypothetical protein